MLNLVSGVHDPHPLPRRVAHFYSGVSSAQNFVNMSRLLIKTATQRVFPVTQNTLPRGPVTLDLFSEFARHQTTENKM